MASLERSGASLTPKATYRMSLAALGHAQKAPRGVSVYSIYVNRPLGRRLAAVADVVGLTPNQVTALSGLSSIVAVAILVALSPSVPQGLGVGAALVLSFALDSADGQLARLQRAGRPSGEWLDHIVDCATKLALHVAVFVAWYRFTDASTVLFVPLAFQYVAVLLFFGGILVGKLRAPAGDESRPRMGRRLGSRASTLLLLPVDYGALCCAFFLWGWPALFEGLYLMLFATHAAFLVAFSVTWFRELS